MIDKRLGFVSLLAFSVSVNVLAQDEEKAEDTKVFSGPQKGEKLLPFKVTGVYDDLAGKELDWVTEAATASPTAPPNMSWRGARDPRRSCSISSPGAATSGSIARLASTFPWARSAAPCTANTTNITPPATTAR